VSDVFDALSVEQQIESLIPAALEVLASYELGELDSVTSLSHEYNSVFAVTTRAGERFALRLNINSPRTLANLNAEVEWLASLATAGLPKVCVPIARSDGSFISSVWHELLGRELSGLLFEWIEGEELGDEPTNEALFALGEAMARLHENALDVSFSSMAALPDFRGFFWGLENHLTLEGGALDGDDREVVDGAIARITAVVNELYERDVPRPIHADLHGGNVMWFDGKVTIFDFDDAGIGVPLQDLATALYYLDTDEQEQALLAGYASVRAVPEYSEGEYKALMLQRRISLLNYLYETSYPEHKAMIPEYQAETIRRINAF
jgi:Ser/Thr protein kinase RdoA (MazF antagonist)